MQWLAALCVKRPVFATVLILSLTVVGVFAFTLLGVDRFPKIDFPTVIVTTAGSATGARSTHHTPSWKSSGSWAATSTASRVFPAPPAPAPSSRGAITASCTTAT